MWPQALQMTRDECRGILRRLELESYSQVISVFRAQGGLSEPKAKLLEELRGIFHISSERHRAEARRVANDEQLATIAEAISGPNTWQEWSREGRRPYPMLPRVAPHTALALISNNIAEETAGENAKLPYPVETSEAIKEDHQQHQERQNANDFGECNSYNVVTSDPFKVPKIPASTKKNLKRNNEQQQQTSSGLSKKRATGDSSPQKNNHHNAHKQHYPHITANSPQANNAGSTANSATHDRRQQHQSSAQQQHLQKQRFFHQQQQLNKQKMAKKSAAASGNINNTSATNKRQPTPAKSGRRANQKLQMEQQQQKQALKKVQATEQQSQSLAVSGTSYSDLNLQQPQQVPGGGSVSLTQQQLDLQFVSYAIQQNHPPQQIFMDEQQTMLLANTMAQPGHAPTLSQQHTPPTVHVTPATLVTPLTPSTALASKASSPQRAVSKRDISKNINKVQQLQHNHYQSNVSPTPSSSSNMAPHDLPPNVGSIISTSSPANVGKTLEKSLISTTPVQKYIVEERQPVGANIPTSLGSIVNLQNPNVTSIVQVSAASNQSPQIMTLPQFSAAATKLRAVNTTLIAPGNKMSPTTMASKKISTITSAGTGAHSNVNAGALHELANVASTQSQVLHMVEQPCPPGNNSTNSNQSFNPPLHTPPAVIRLQSSTQAPTSTSSASDLPASCVSVATAQQSTSGLLTTKILPMVLGGTSNQTPTTNSSVVFSSSPTTSTVSTSTTANIIKNLPSTMVLNTSTSNLTPVTVTGTIFSTLGAGATVFRKPPNIIKTTSVSGSCSTSKTNSYSSSTSTMTTGAPHIISNVKLTPMNATSSAATGTALSSTTSFKNVLPSASGGMMRTSVKICQSPNGKVVIQPAGLVDGSKMKTLPHKIFTNTTSTSVAGPASTVGGGSGQRIAIQKVQIIPAPLGSPSGGNVLQAGGNTKTSPLAGKSNMIFMPSTAAANVRPVTLSKMGSNFLLKSAAVSNAQLPFSSDTSVPKTNIVVLGPNTPVKDASLNHKKLESNSSLITDDNTPLDILNMPIVMDSGVEVGMASSAETVTVLPSNIIESNSNSSTAPITIVDQASASTLKPQAGQQTVILAATDWEMELDQAITTAAHNVTNTHQKPSHNKQKLNIASPSSACNSTMNLNSFTRSSGQMQKRLNNELISIELKPKGDTASSVNSLNKIIVVDSFDEVIVEEHEDDMSSNIEHHVSPNMSDTAPNAKNNDNQPKILDMKIYQQHDSIAGGHTSTISIAENPSEQMSPLKSITKSQNFLQSATEPIHTQQGPIIHLTPHETPHRGHQHAVECEVDAGFDETIVTEIDENTAIEYIEEDGSVIIPNMTTVSTTPATATVTVVTNNMEDELANAKETIVTTVSNDGSEKHENDLMEDTIQSLNSCAGTNHLEIYAIQKNTTDAKSAQEVVVGSLSQQQQQQHETIANNSVT